MKKINILKNGELAFSSGIKTNTEADTWLADCLAKNKFGKLAVYDSILNTETGEIEQILITPAEVFEVIEIDVTAEVEAEAQKQAKITAGKAAREACQRVLDLVAGYNLDRELTIEQITQMQSTFANAEASLRAGRPTYAKQFIAAIQADEVLVTQEMKDLCLELLEGY